MATVKDYLQVGVNMNKSFQFKVELLRHKWPLFAFGFVGCGGSEFIVSLWLVDFRFSWGY